MFPTICAEPARTLRRSCDPKKRARSGATHWSAIRLEMDPISTYPKGAPGEQAAVRAGASRPGRPVVFRVADSYQRPASRLSFGGVIVLVLGIVLIVAVPPGFLGVPVVENGAQNAGT